jgi:hypothetical protein
MATITMRKSKKKGFTTITMKAGKGEDLRGVVEALAGKKFDAKPEEKK